MTVLVWLHLVGASLWLGGLVTLAAVVLVAARTVPRDAFGRSVRTAGWTFAGLSGLAWALLGVSGLVLAARLGWPVLAVVKAALGGGSWPPRPCTSSPDAARGGPWCSSRGGSRSSC